MPFKDGTGPIGRGPLSGRGSGFCRSVVDAPYQYGNQLGRHRGFGRNYCFRNTLPTEVYEYDQKAEKEYLLNKISFFENRIEYFKKYLSEIEKKEK